MSGERTNFGQYSHAELYQMLYAGDPNTATNAAGTWDATGNNLHDQASNLESKLSGFSQNWQGGAADQYKTMITDLVGGIRKVADTAYSMRNLALDAADAQDTARQQMPMPMDVPTVSPATVAMATTPIQVDSTTPASTVMQMQQAQAQAVAAVQSQQAAQNASDAAHAQAVQVMTTLASTYVTTQSSIPPSPDAETIPTTNTPMSMIGTGTDQLVATPIGADGSGGGTSGLNPNTPVTDPSWNQSGDLTNLPDQGLITDPTGGASSDSPLFGGMFTAGVAAASAAVFGRFGSLIPKVPSFVKGKSGTGTTSTDGTGTGTGTGLNPDGTPAKLGDKMTLPGAMGGGGGAGGAKIPGGIGKIGGIGGVGAGAGMAGSGPSASPSMMGGSGLNSALDAGVAGAAGAGASGSASSPMMPMMPMGGMGGQGGDMGGGRRVPPWLVETEDVWGESSAVSPPILGEELF